MELGFIDQTHTGFQAYVSRLIQIPSSADVDANSRLVESWNDLIVGETAVDGSEFDWRDNTWGEVETVLVAELGKIPEVIAVLFSPEESEMAVITVVNRPTDDLRRRIYEAEARAYKRVPEAMTLDFCVIDLPADRLHEFDNRQYRIIHLRDANQP